MNRQIISVEASEDSPQYYASYMSGDTPGQAAGKMLAVLVDAGVPITKLEVNLPHSCTPRSQKMKKVERVWTVNLAKFGGKDSACVDWTGTFDDYDLLLDHVAAELRSQGQKLPKQGSALSQVAKFFMVDPAKLDRTAHWFHSGACNNHLHKTHRLAISAAPYNQLASLER